MNTFNQNHSSRPNPYYPNSAMSEQQHLFNQRMQQQQQCYAMQQPVGGFGVPPQHMNHQQQQSGVFNNNLFMQTHNASVDIIDTEQVLFVKNYQMLDKLSEDKELNTFYFSNPDYLWRLFYKQLTECGRWLEGAYAVFNSVSALIITTPSVTLRVDKDILKFYYQDQRVEPMNEEQVKNGLIPILKMIEKLYVKDEEVKRQAEVDRLKEDEVKEDTNPGQSPVEPEKREYIGLRHRQIKNPKANYSAFLKNIDSVESGLSGFLHLSTEEIRHMVECAMSDVYVLHLCNDITFDRNNLGYPVVIVGDLKITLTPTNKSPMLQFFEYADLRDDKLIEATITLCRQLAIIESKVH